MFIDTFIKKMPSLPKSLLSYFWITMKALSMTLLRGLVKLEY
jgi:hypothetical protein